MTAIPIGHIILRSLLELFLVPYHLRQVSATPLMINHDDVIKWKHFPRYWPLVRGIHRSPVNSPHKGQWRGALVFSLICAWINGWANNREAGDLRRYRAHYDVTVMPSFHCELVWLRDMITEEWFKEPVIMVIYHIWFLSVVLNICFVIPHNLRSWYLCLFIRIINNDRGDFLHSHGDDTIISRRCPVI